MAGARTGIVAGESSSLDLWIRLGLASGRVIDLSFSDTAPETTLDTHPLMDRLLAYVDDHEQEEFRDVELGLTVSTDQRRIFERLREIPYGHQRSIDELATATLGTGNEDSHIQTATTALSANPIPIILPDHRIRDASGATPTRVRTHLRELEGLT